MSRSGHDSEVQLTDGAVLPPARWSPRPVALPNPYLPYILAREEYEGRLLHVAAYPQRV